MSKNNARNAANAVVGAIASKIKASKTNAATAPVANAAPVVAPAKKSKTAAPAAPVATKTASVAGAFLVKGAAQDALKGRVGARTHAIHVVLLDAARLGALLSTKAITEQATAFMQQTDAGATCNATASHLNTMSCEQAGRLFLIREQGAWRLTDAALTLCGAEWAQDVKQSKKSKK